LRSSLDSCKADTDAPEVDAVAEEVPANADASEVDAVTEEVPTNAEAPADADETEIKDAPEPESEA